MEWLRKHAWKLAILLLPWQMRWFSEGISLGGLPWEQGRWSVYGSWFVMTIVTGLAFSQQGASLTWTKRQKQIMIAGISLFAFPSIFTMSWQATAQWWIEVALLAGLVAPLIRLRVSRESLAFWLIVSLIPHACLALWQWQAQMVVGTKWLGMATQDPLIPGVSVIETSSGRFLRAYGGFPHPNIFGGWLAGALTVSVWLVSRLSKVWQRWFLTACTGLFSAVFVLTFARGAWISVVVGIALATLLAWKEKKGRVHVWRVLVVMALAVTVTAWQTRELIAVRMTTAPRLEAKSVDERREGWENGQRLFEEHASVGVGLNATAWGIARQTGSEPPRSPLLPHVVTLLILDEVGVIGSVGFVLLAWCVWIRRQNRSAWLLLAVWLVLGCFDHYPWSLWAGRSWTALVIAWILLAEDTEKRP
ncbi:MAG: O-antigen ligase family protein [Patescibacteria group bacterium]